VGELVNLRLARKARKREDADRAAAASRAKHGATKGERQVCEAEVARLDRHLAGARREAED
jgi:hypothetical protein